MQRQAVSALSQAGHERLRQLLVVGAMAVISHAKPGSQSASAWLLQLLERKPRKLAAVALANKAARIVWARLAKVPADRWRLAGRPGKGRLAKVPADRWRLAGRPGEGMMSRGEAYRRQPVAA